MRSFHFWTRTCSWWSEHRKLYHLTLTCRGTLRKFRGLLTQLSSAFNKLNSSWVVSTLIFIILPKLNGSIEKSDVELCSQSFLDSIWHRLLLTWLYSSIEHNELSENFKGSTEKREFSLECEDILIKAN